MKTKTFRNRPHAGRDPPANPGLGKRFFVVLAIGFIFLHSRAANPAPIKAAWAEFERIIQLKSDPLPASPAKLSGHEIEGLSSMAPQQQPNSSWNAPSTLRRRHRTHRKKCSGWYGQLEVEKGPLANLLNTAITHDYASAPPPSKSLWPGYNLPKSPERWTVLTRLQDERDSCLGSYGFSASSQSRRGNRAPRNRLPRSIHDPMKHRAYASSVSASRHGQFHRAALESFRSDPSPNVREGAACALAQSGMFTQEQRLRAVPGLLQMMDDHPRPRHPQLGLPGLARHHRRRPSAPIRRLARLGGPTTVAVSCSRRLLFRFPFSIFSFLLVSP